MSVRAVSVEEPSSGRKSYIDKAIASRLKQADVNHDGELDQAELKSLVKDLIYEDRSNKRLLLLAVVSALLLMLSVGANFGLVLFATEISKESHVSPIVQTETAVGSVASRRRMLQQADALSSFDKKLEDIRGEPSAMTAKDRKSIVEMQEAHKKLPLYVTPNLDGKLDASSTPSQLPESRIKSITYDVYDYEQNAKKDAPTPYLRTKTMDVEDIEKLSPTHIKFKGKDGESVEVKDGKAIATAPDAGLDTILRSPAFAGSKLHPKITNEATIGRTKRPAGSSAPEPRSYSTPDPTKQTAPLTQPICGAPMATVASSSVDSLKELEALEEEAVARLEERGIDMKDKREAMARRQAERSQGTQTAAGRRLQLRPLAAGDFSEMAKPPAAFDDACSDPVKTVLVPAVESLAQAHRKVNKDAEQARCNRDQNPACYACTDSPLGCVPIELEHNGRLGDQIKKRASESSVAIPPAAPKTTKLFVSEPVGNARPSVAGDNTEVFIADEGICGVKAKGDSAKTIKAIAFKGCASKKWGEYMGIKGRAIEMKAKQAEAKAGKAVLENAFGSQINGAGPSTLVPTTTEPSGLEDLPFEWVDDGSEAFNGFSAKEGNGIGKLMFTRDANFSRNETDSGGRRLSEMDSGRRRLTGYSCSASKGVELGDGGGLDFPPPRFVPPDDTATTTTTANSADEVAAPVATLGTRLLGAVVHSDESLQSMTLMFKDDCIQYIEQLDKYMECQERVKGVQQSAPAEQFPTEDFLQSVASADSPAEIQAISPSYQAVTFPSPSPPPLPPQPPSRPPPPPPPPPPFFPPLALSNAEQMTAEVSGGMDGGVVAGIVLGCIAGLLIIAGILLYRRMQASTPKAANIPLPPYWQEMKDSATKRSYFYNTMTGATSWTRPTEDPV